MNQKYYFPLLLISTVFVLSFSACAPAESPEPTMDVTEIVQQVAATLQMGYTQTAQAMPTATNTPEPTSTSIPSPSPASGALVISSPTATAPPTFAGPTALPIDPATANGCYNAWFVADVTIPPGTAYKTGDKFTKTWRLLNTGTCDWNGDFKITYVGGNIFGSDTTKIRQRVGVGGTADISLDMVAPDLEGTAISNWQMATDTGSLFGPVLSASILLPGGIPTSSAGGDCFDATLVSESTDPSGKLDPGAKFTKTWQIENSGSCVWTVDFKFTYVGGYLFGSDTTKIRKRVEPGATLPISLDMVAPGSSGNASSSWQMADNSGGLFGDVFTFQIQVK